MGSILQPLVAWPTREHHPLDADPPSDYNVSKNEVERSGCLRPQDQVSTVGSANTATEFLKNRRGPDAAFYS
jgi:hypothetical protein